MQSLTEKVFDVPKLEKLIKDCEHLNNPETHTNQEKEPSLETKLINSFFNSFQKVVK